MGHLFVKNVWAGKRGSLVILGGGFKDFLMFAPDDLGNDPN